VIFGSGQSYGFGLKITEPIIKKTYKKAKDNETKSHIKNYKKIHSSEEII